MCGAKIGLCLPRNNVATSVARRPSTAPSASMRGHSRVMSADLGVEGRKAVPGATDAARFARKAPDRDHARSPIFHPPLKRPPTGWPRLATVPHDTVSPGHEVQPEDAAAVDAALSVLLDAELE